MSEEAKPGRRSEIEVGIRIGETGVAYFGVEQVNRELAAGARVVELRPGGAVVHKLGEAGESVRVSLAGCQLIVVLESP